MVATEEKREIPPSSNKEPEYNGRVRAAGPLIGGKTLLSTVAQNIVPFLTLPLPGFKNTPTLQTWVLSLSPSPGFSP